MTLSDITYGTALLLAKAYHNNDLETAVYLNKNLEISEITESANLLLRIILNSFPQGRISNDHGTDVRIEVLSNFLNYLSLQPKRLTDITKEDTRETYDKLITLANTFVVPYTTNFSYSGLPPANNTVEGYEYVLFIAAILDSALYAFSNHIASMSGYKRLTRNGPPSWNEGVAFLLGLLPAVTMKSRAVLGE